MRQLLPDGFDFLFAHEWANLFTLFLMLIAYDIPRYYLGFIAAAVQNVCKGRNSQTCGTRDFVSVVIAGLNEEDDIVRCVLSLRAQSRPPDEIIVVSDGSTDRTPEQLRDLQARGLIREAHCTQLRSGKAAALNLGIGRAAGTIIVAVDADSALLDRHALKNIIEPFADPHVGAVAGNVQVRNAKASLIATCQAIEYMICISLGKRAADLTGEIACVSGAFGAFRREVLDRLGGYDAGGSEDSDLTIRLRTIGSRIRFAPRAIIYTYVPVTLPALIRQRFRWEQYTISYAYRRHNLVNPFRAQVKLSELWRSLDFFLFTVMSPFVFLVYIYWQFLHYGAIVPVVLVMVQVVVASLESSALILAGLLTPEVRVLPLLPFMLSYSVFYAPLMRFVRAAAYIREWVFNASYRADDVPGKVHSQRF